MAQLADFVDQMTKADPNSYRRAFAQAQDVRITPELLRANSPTLLVAGQRELQRAAEGLGPRIKTARCLLGCAPVAVAPTASNDVGRMETAVIPTHRSDRLAQEAD